MSGTRNLDGLKTQALTCVEVAYDKGYKSGLNDGNINDGTFAAKVKEAYNNGLNDAWECARRIYEMPCDVVCELFPDSNDVIFADITASEAIEKIRKYDEKKRLNERCDTCEYQHCNRGSFPCYDCCDNDRWESKDDNKINVGNEIIFNGEKYIVVNKTKYENNVIIANGTNVLVADVENVKKTGRKYPIADMLEGLK